MKNSPNTSENISETDSNHVHDFVFSGNYIEGPECCFGPVPCSHCGNCITGSGTHNFDPTEPDGYGVSRYTCSVCGQIRDEI